MEALEGQIPVKVSYVLVNDGSKDDTLSVMRKANAGRPDAVHYISFSRNFGKEAALAAGMRRAVDDGYDLLGVGAVGLYISKIYSETKNRPLYIIEEEK